MLIWLSCVFKSFAQETKLPNPPKKEVIPSNHGRKKVDILLSENE